MNAPLESGNSEPVPAVDAANEQLRAENARLRKIVRILMDRVERSAGQDSSEFGRFQTALVLEDLVERRTEELSRALRQNERVTRSLKQSEARFRGLADQSLAGIAIVEGSKFAYVNSRFAETFGYSHEEIMAITPIHTVAPGSRRQVLEHVEKCLLSRSHGDLLEYEGRTKDGSSVDIELAGSRLKLGDKVAAIFVITDITVRKRAEHEVQALNRRLAEMALRDPLTGLYNRRFMEESLEREVNRAVRGGIPVSVVMCDLDDFKRINDTYGHQIGDEVIDSFGSRLKQHCRKSDIACRYGGEEFLVVFPGMPADLAVTWAERIRMATANAQIPVGADSLRVTASFGVAAFPLHGHSWQEVIAAADAAQYAAKAGGKDQVRRAPTGDTSTDPGSSRPGVPNAGLRSRRMPLTVAGRPQ